MMNRPKMPSLLILRNVAIRSIRLAPAKLTTPMRAMAPEAIR